MATFKPEDVGVAPPSSGFSEGGWYGGRQYWGGTLSEPGVIHPASSQQGAGQTVSAEVNAQSAAQQGVEPQQFESYLQKQRQQSVGVQPTSPGSAVPGTGTPTAGDGSTGDTGAIPGVAAPATINLPELYKNLYDTSGIKEREEEYTQKEKEYIEAKGKINDNPFLSEATRVGRVAKIETLFQERTANLRNEIATKKADIETQLNLQTKQFDIESQASQQALSQFNTLLQMGALDNASGETIASLTRSTGISSDLIYSAIKASTAKDVNTQVITPTAENGEMFAVVLNTDTGAVIKKTSLGVIGNVQQGPKPDKPTEREEAKELQSTMVGALEGVKNSYGHVSPQDWQGALASWINRGGTKLDFIENFKQYADPNREKDFKEMYFFEKSTLYGGE